MQRAGIFDSTTIRARSSGDLLDWLSRNGYQAPARAETAIREYIDRGWVFVASKARVNRAGTGLTTLHPLMFTFAAKSPVYPTRLTAVADGACAIDLFVFGDGRAAAKHFGVARCDRILPSAQNGKRAPRPGLAIDDPEFLALMGQAKVGTKLSGRLTPEQMASDVEIDMTPYRRAGRYVYSPSAAGVVALNLALPLGVAGWLLTGGRRDAWGFQRRGLAAWRGFSLLGAIGLGLITFLLLPKVEVETRTYSANFEEAAVR